MNIYSHLIIPFDDFSSKINTLIENGNQISNIQVTSAEEYNNFEQQYKEWSSVVQRGIQESFADPNTAFIPEFNSIRRNFQILNAPATNWRQEVVTNKAHLANQILFLVMNLKIIKACDIIRSNPFDVDVRAKYPVRKKTDFVLNKLYDLNDDLYYPLEILFTGNGLRLNNSSEVREIASNLENLDYILSVGGMGSDISAKITTSGSIYVEESLLAYIEDYEDISSSQEAINKTIDEIKDQLNKLGLGQEIIFNEIDELKTLFPLLNKKSFGQIVKGKLLDIGLGKLLDTDTLNWIYHELVGHGLKLLS